MKLQSGKTYMWKDQIFKINSIENFEPSQREFTDYRQYVFHCTPIRFNNKEYTKFYDISNIHEQCEIYIPGMIQDQFNNFLKD